MFRKLPHDTILSMMQTIGFEYVFERYHNFTAINFAVARNNPDLTKQLIQRGADLHVNSEQPLRNACKLGHLEIVQCLVEAGADFNAVDEKGNTPLHYAQKKEFDAIVAWLKTKGAK
jgi:ankyrin repeat protein